MNRELEGKVALVTGGSSGIGMSVCKLFATEGAKVVIGDIKEAPGSAAHQPDSPRFLRTDVRVASQVQSLVDSAIKEFGGIDIVVNDAGVEQNRLVSETSEEEWDLIMDTNLKSQYLVCKYAYPHMAKKKGGAIVNIASQLGLVALPGRSAYCASKAGVILLTKVLALEYAGNGIRVNCICPGPIQTPMLERTLALDPDREASLKTLVETVPLGRTGSPDEVAQAVLFLASGRSSYITGEYLLVDGGYVIS